ncbi:MAG: hypothetical protein QF681_17540 [Vicinamibacterales bacterium]|nr:hypothetical protein [Vicinamibacterales bacterium]
MPRRLACFLASATYGLRLVRLVRHEQHSGLRVRLNEPSGPGEIVHVRHDDIGNQAGMGVLNNDHDPHLDRQVTVDLVSPDQVIQ